MTTPPVVPAEPPAPAIGHLRAGTDPASYDYLLGLPEGYDAQPERHWPVVLFLHGVIERGHNVWEVIRQGPPRLMAGVPTLTAAEQQAAEIIAHSFVFIAPQCPQHATWDDATLLRLLDQAGRTIRVDPERVFLTGLSMGGFGAWSLGLRHPSRFRAIVPVCGGGRLADVATAVRTQPAALRRLAVWAFHGAKDAAVPLEESTRMVDALRAAEVPNVRLTVYPECEHDAWTQAYAGRELYEWLLSL